MARFVAILGTLVNLSSGVDNSILLRVVYRTGLQGFYEFTLEFSGMQVPPQGFTTASPMGVAAGTGTGDPGEGGPTLFSAVEKQLGLKLQKVKNVPVDILVVDHADKVPTQN